MFKIVVQINKPANAVFTFLSDIESSPRWYSAVKSVTKLSPGPVNRGSLYSFSRELPGKKVDNRVEVTEFVDGKLLTLSSIEGPTPFKYRYELTPLGDKTQLRLEAEISGQGLTGPIALLAPLASSFFERGMHTNLVALKDLIEQGL
jgi:uncharacterized membrane protein